MLGFDRRVLIHCSISRGEKEGREDRSRYFPRSGCADQVYGRVSWKDRLQASPSPTWPNNNSLRTLRGSWASEWYLYIVEGRSKVKVLENIPFLELMLARSTPEELLEFVLRGLGWFRIGHLVGWQKQSVWVTLGA